MINVTTYFCFLLLYNYKLDNNAQWNTDQSDNDTVHWRAFGPFWHAFGIPWLCYLAWWAETLAKQTNSLPISARLKQPSLMQGDQKRRRRGPETRQSTVIVIKVNVRNWSHGKISVHWQRNELSTMLASSKQWCHCYIYSRLVFYALFGGPIDPIGPHTLMFCFQILEFCLPKSWRFLVYVIPRGVGKVSFLLYKYHCLLLKSRE